MRMQRSVKISKRSVKNFRRLAVKYKRTFTFLFILMIMDQLTLAVAALPAIILFSWWIDIIYEEYLDYDESDI